MTDAQRLIFKTRLNEFFNIIEQEIEGKKIENTGSIDLWAKNLCDRYRNLKKGVNPRHFLAKEHIETLTKKLDEKGITIDEFVETRGKREKIIEILKSKKQNNSKEDTISKTLEEYSIEELKNIQAKYDEEIVSLNQKHTQKYKNLYSLSDTKYEEIGKRLDTAKKSRKRINEIIEKKLKEQENVSGKQLELVDNSALEQENVEIIEIPEIEEKKPAESKQKTRKQKTASEKITELMKEEAEKDKTIRELKSEIENYEKTKQDVNSKYQEIYERRISRKEEQLEQEYAEKYQTTKEKYIKQLEDQKKKFEAYKQEQERQKITSENQNKNAIDLQKQEIVKMLCTKDDISLADIRKQLENKNIKTDGIEDTIIKLKNEIPGIVKSISQDGTIFTYSIKNNATKQLEDYKKWDFSPKISTVYDGEVSFIVRSDLHLNMNSSEDTIKKILSPSMDYCAKNGNIPIIDLGDLAETMKEMKYISWKNMDKEAIKQAYKFYRNYAKAISTAKEIDHYTLLGNHDEHPFNAGVDPLAMLLEYSDNFKTLGIASGSFEIGNEKIAVYHDTSWQNIIKYSDCPKQERDVIIYDYLCDEVKKIAQDYIYSLIGHYHFGAHNPEQNFTVVKNGIDNQLLFTAQVKEGHVEKMFATELIPYGQKLIKSNYQIEIYNRGRSITK